MGLSNQEGFYITCPGNTLEPDLNSSLVSGMLKILLKTL